MVDCQSMSCVDILQPAGVSVCRVCVCVAFLRRFVSIDGVARENVRPQLKCLTSTQ